MCLETLDNNTTRIDGEEEEREGQKTTRNKELQCCCCCLIEKLIFIEREIGLGACDMVPDVLIFVSICEWK